MKPIDLHTLARGLSVSVQPLPHEDVTDLSRKADRLGILHAVISQAKAEAASIRTELEDAGLAHVDGQLYRVTFAACAGATRIDWQAIAKKYKPSRQLIAAHTTTGEESVRMTVTAKPTH